MIMFTILVALNMSIVWNELESAGFVRAKKEAFFGVPFLGSKMDTSLDHIKCSAFNEVLCNNTKLMGMHSNAHLNNKNGLMLRGPFLGFRGGPEKSRHSTGMVKTAFFGYF